MMLACLWKKAVVTGKVIRRGLDGRWVGGLLGGWEDRWMGEWMDTCVGGWRWKGVQRKRPQRGSG